MSTRRRRARSRSLNTPPSKRLDLVQDGAAGVEQREPHDDRDLHDVSPSVEPRAVYRWPHLNHKSEALARRVALPWRSDSDQITRVSGKKRMPGLAEEPRRARTGYRRGVGGSHTMLPTNTTRSAAPAPSRSHASARSDGFDWSGCKLSPRPNDHARRAARASS